MELKPNRSIFNNSHSHSGITVSAPGKIHFMGEHAVVYGKPALLSAINLRVFVTISELGKSMHFIKKKSYRNQKNKKDQIIIKTDENEEYIRQIIDKTKEFFHETDQLPAVFIQVKSDIKSGFHLGSSAAVAVATAGAILYFTKKVFNPELINKIAYEAEKIQHGNPSGGDNTVCTFGKLVWYRKELEFLRSMWQLPLKIPQAMNHFFLIDTGKPKESTGEMVEYVRSQLLSQKSKYEKLFNENEKQTKRIATAIKAKDESELMRGIIMGEKTLEKLGVVSPYVIPLIRHIEHTGGAVKILGGGGRTKGVGYLLVYHSRKKIIDKICKSYRFNTRSITLGEEGVRLEKT